MQICPAVFYALQIMQISNNSTLPFAEVRDPTTTLEGNRSLRQQLCRQVVDFDQGSKEYAPADVEENYNYAYCDVSTNHVRHAM